MIQYCNFIFEFLEVFFIRYYIIRIAITVTYALFESSRRRNVLVLFTSRMFCVENPKMVKSFNKSQVSSYELVASQLCCRSLKAARKSLP